MIFFSDSKGLTLIEVVIASLLLVSVLAPIFTLMHSCLGSYHSAGDRSQLVVAGKGIMEETLASKDYTIKQHSGLTYSGDINLKYDLSISSYQGNHNLRNIEVRVYVSGKPDKQLYLNTIRTVR
ncbi:type IV pilus modification PilV family protein [Desulfitibacter alkalitolerans]|uniref:type IV pilus modification PilV family protein n=1 Tax=Desulfitibacter alkalitolerans TaxID=264641 RepID=UPI000481075F|nr:hypothetical protein [Desulfitibacter alkalitolerans]